ncbi:MAG TPA: carboxypeptidase-like regulatory domain-containing protein, partial [Puia sp.]|nr:carboxypeptidase-like regulatory domain-containing protein [Puia sp.]
MNKLFLAIILLMSLPTLAQRKITISGTLKSRAKGETLIGATVRADGTGGSVSNEYGFYSISLPAGSHSLEFTAVGLQSRTLTVNLTRDTSINIFLADDNKSLDEVTVTASSKRRSLSSPQMGLDHVSTSEIKNIPVLLGERDPIKV